MDKPKKKHLIIINTDYIYGDLVRSIAQKERDFYTTVLGYDVRQINPETFESTSHRIICSDGLGNYYYYEETEIELVENSKVFSKG